MTNREFFQTVINANINADITAHAEDALAKLDATNAKRAEKAAEKSAENVAAINALVPYLTGDPQTATDLMQYSGASVQRTSYLLRTAVKMGLCEVTDVKVAKKGMQKGYFVSGVATTEATETEATNAADTETTPVNTSF